LHEVILSLCPVIKHAATEHLTLLDQARLFCPCQLEVPKSKCQLEVPESKADKQQCLFKTIQAINSKLEPLNLSVGNGVDEDDGLNYFMLVNTSSRVVVAAGTLLGRSETIHWSSFEF
jgi:hypothetical protein